MLKVLQQPHPRSSDLRNHPSKELDTSRKSSRRTTWRLSGKSGFKEARYKKLAALMGVEASLKNRESTVNCRATPGLRVNSRPVAAPQDGADCRNPVPKQEQCARFGCRTIPANVTKNDAITGKRPATLVPCVMSINTEAIPAPGLLEARTCCNSPASRPDSSPGRDHVSRKRRGRCRNRKLNEVNQLQTPSASLRTIVIEADRIRLRNGSAEFKLMEPSLDHVLKSVPFAGSPVEGAGAGNPPRNRD